MKRRSTKAAADQGLGRRPDPVDRARRLRVLIGRQACYEQRPRFDADAAQEGPAQAQAREEGQDRRQVRHHQCRRRCPV